MPTKYCIVVDWSAAGLYNQVSNVRLMDVFFEWEDLRSSCFKKLWPVLCMYECTRIRGLGRCILLACFCVVFSISE